jgi:hypothetical protein
VFVIFATWAGLMWVVPYTVDSGTIGDLDGLVGYQDHPETFEDLNPVARAMYKAGDKQCHQKESRTLILNDNEMPFCARDVGIYTLMAIGIAISMFPRLPKYDRLTDIKWYWMVIAPRVHVAGAWGLPQGGGHGPGSLEDRCAGCTAPDR